MPQKYPFKVQSYFCPRCGPSLAPLTPDEEPTCLFCPDPEDEITDAAYDDDEEYL
jgi:hypothetical protein